jgi:hypothetical protein
MALYLDHAFVLCDVGAPEAEVLTRRGFVEGSANVHPGQGTANRRFFFANFMLELLWVAHPAETASDAVRHTGLWERWSRRTTGASRFGLIYGGVQAQGSSPLFITESYYPTYFPPQTSIEIVQGLSLDEPALFWIPSLSADRRKRSEPTNHQAAVRIITGVSIGVPTAGALSLSALKARDAGLLDFFDSASPVLEVHFQGEGEDSIDCRPHLPVVFRAIRQL